MRIFIAVDLPDSLREAIGAIEPDFTLPGIKLVKPNLVHITMKFLGEVEETKIPEICTALTSIHCASFETTLENIGVFPKLDYIKVIWIGATGNFEALHREVDRIMKDFGFKPEKDFIAHATIARVKRMDKKDRIPLKEKLSKLADISIGKFSVDSISVKKSTLTPQGPIYETLCNIPLK